MATTPNNISGTGSTSCVPDYSKCMFKTITLTKGEQFIIPADAVIMAITDPTKVQALNGCIDLATLPATCCFHVYIASSDNSDCSAGLGVSTGETPVYNEVFIQGISLNGIDYPFTSQLEVDGFYNGNVNGVQNLFNTTNIGPLLHVTAVQYTTNDNRGSMARVVITVPCDMGNNLFLYGSGTTNGVGQPSVKVYFRFKPC